MSFSWPRFALSAVCREITDGSHFSPATCDSGYPYITVRDIVAGEIDLGGAKRIDSASFAHLVANGCQPEMGDVLFSKDGTVGKVAQVRSETPFVVLSSLAILRPDPARVDSTYLAYALRDPALLKAALGRKTGVAIKRIILKNLKSLTIPLPPLVVQRRIADVLDNAFEKIETAVARAEQNRANAAALFQRIADTLMRAQADWRTSPLADLGHLTTGSTPKGSSEGSYGGDVPFIKPGDFRPDGTLNYDNEGLSEIGLRQSRMIPAGSALMVCIGATIGKTGFTERDIAANQQVNAFVPGPEVSARFVFHQMRTARFQSDVMNNAAQATLPIINKSKWGALAVSYPALDEQRQIARMLDEMRSESAALTSIYTRKLTLLAELKQSLLAQAFSGNLALEPLVA